MGHTGRDLFRITDLLAEMAMSERFLGPLSAFRKRVAYANGYHTDFPVPVSTAAFLHPESDYPHHLADGDEHSDGVDQEGESGADGNGNGGHGGGGGGGGKIVATLHTFPRNPAVGTSTMVPLSLRGGERDNGGDLVCMSVSLDSLGWKKVIVDLRDEMPSLRVGLPRVLAERFVRNGGDSGGGAGGDNSPCTSVGDDRDDDVDMRKTRGSVLRSGEVASAFSYQRGGGVHFPLGHNMMVAFSRTRLSSLVNRGGRPVMDKLAAELVDDILSYEVD